MPEVFQAENLRRDFSVKKVRREVEVSEAGERENGRKERAF